MPPVKPAPKLSPTAPRITATPPVMYSQPLRAAAFHHRRARRSCARRSARRPGRRRTARPAVAPYSTVLPMMVLWLAAAVRGRRRPHHDGGAGQALADIVVGVAEHFQLQPLHREGAERLAGRAAQPHRQMVRAAARSCRSARVICDEILVPMARCVLRMLYCSCIFSPSLEQRRGVGDHLRVQRLRHLVAAFQRAIARMRRRDRPAPAAD